MRLSWGAEQLSEADGISFEEALIENSHNSDGSRFVMFGGDVSIGDLQLINDADARMSESVILKTVPEVSMLMLIFYVMLCYVMLCYVMLCYVMLCYVMLCYVYVESTKQN